MEKNHQYNSTEFLLLCSTEEEKKFMFMFKITCKWWGNLLGWTVIVIKCCFLWLSYWWDFLTTFLPHFISKLIRCLVFFFLEKFWFPVDPHFLVSVYCLHVHLSIMLLNQLHLYKHKNNVLYVNFSHTALPLVCTLFWLLRQSASHALTLFSSQHFTDPHFRETLMWVRVCCVTAVFSGVVLSLSLSSFSLLCVFKMNGLKNPNIRSSLPPLPLFLCCLSLSLPSFTLYCKHTSLWHFCTLYPLCPPSFSFVVCTFVWSTIRLHDR